MGKKFNYQIKMDEILREVDKEKQGSGNVSSLLLHACCAPCSSYVLEYLSGCFDITVLYYNPNISGEAEYRKRVRELERLLGEMPMARPVNMIEGNYEPKEYFEAVKGLEQLGERSARCYACYELRLAYTARTAKEQGYDYFTTTLSISPHKDANWLNEIGERMAGCYGLSYLYADFKKRNGYQRSIELSEQYHLYRQDFCGCIYSRAERENTGNTLIL